MINLTKPECFYLTSVCLLQVLKLSDWSLVTSLHISQVTTQISPTRVITPFYHFVHSKTAISIISTLSPTRPTLFQIFIPFSLSATQYLNHNFKLHANFYCYKSHDKGDCRCPDIFPFVLLHNSKIYLYCTHQTFRDDIGVGLYILDLYL